MTTLDHCQNRFFGTCEYSLHRTVAAVGHPAFNAELERGDLRPGAEADALDLPADDYAADHLHRNALP